MKIMISIDETVDILAMALDIQVEDTLEADYETVDEWLKESEMQMTIEDANLLLSKLLPMIQSGSVDLTGKNERYKGFGFVMKDDDSFSVRMFGRTEQSNVLLWENGRIFDAKVSLKQ